MFVGDSLNRGQWLSMVCLLQSVIPAEKRFMSRQAHLTSFRTEEYNASIEFLWAPFLDESNSDDPVGHRLPEKILRPDSNLRKQERESGKGGNCYDEKLPIKNQTKESNHDLPTSGWWKKY
ncbi:hypothetical protein K7X08_037878 [Anisodus acutangulus]|uniref:Trichome birefringence-like C-terminal domain-containing protein n=1 Tax=Anisodus acutangulus TaxID=402998 RepID=A0A9Q1MXF9_9SOLA|nr:hypothetical protein K7X08_037878 [Anisodus acutangulus]